MRLRRQMSQDTREPYEFKIRFPDIMEYWSYVTHFANSRVLSYTIVFPTHVPPSNNAA